MCRILSCVMERSSSATTWKTSDWAVFIVDMRNRASSSASCFAVTWVVVCIGANTNGNATFAQAKVFARTFATLARRTGRAYARHHAPPPPAVPARPRAPGPDGARRGVHAADRRRAGRVVRDGAAWQVAAGADGGVA